MRPRQRSKRAFRRLTGPRLSSIALIFFPLAGGLLGRLVTDLLYMPAGPILLVFFFAAFKIVCYAAMLDLVADLKLVFERVARCHSRRLSLKSESRLDLNDVFSKML